KSFDNDSSVVLERNPYYWCVMPNGDQLPYLDEVRITLVSDAQAGLLRVQQGSVDYCHGPFNQIALTDVEGLRNSTEQAGTEVLLWDGGDGVGSIFFFNYDYVDDDVRALIREPKFRQAISHAFDREPVRKAVYYNTGELTTGTHGTKSTEFHVDEAGQQLYQQWRDAYVQHDPDRAKQLLDELGVKDVDGDGWRELPNGKKLELRVEFAANMSQEHVTKDNQLVADLKAVGLKLTRVPIAPQSYGDQWKTGTLMAHTNWGIANVGISFIQPMWLVPVEPDRWAPLEGRWYQLRGTGTNEKELDVSPWERHPPRMEPEPDGPVARLWELYDRGKVETDELKRF